MEYIGVRPLASFSKLLKGWSGGRGSNPRRPAWEAGILPLNYPRSTDNLTLFPGPCKRTLNLASAAGTQRIIRLVSMALGVVA